MLICCQRCSHYGDCVRKWILAQREIDTPCCYECQYFEDCFNQEMRNRWAFLGHAEEEEGIGV